MRGQQQHRGKHGDERRGKPSGEPGASSQAGADHVNVEIHRSASLAETTPAAQWLEYATCSGGDRRTISLPVGPADQFGGAPQDRIVCM
jgi:hypothetical protein